MESPLRYRRRTTAGLPDFQGTTRSLDPAQLRETWAPWVDLSLSPRTHTAIRNAHFLGLPWSAATDSQGDELLDRPWFAILHAGGLRSWVLAQARIPDFLSGKEQQNDAEVPEPMLRLREDLARPLTDFTPLRRLTLVALMAAMTSSEQLRAVPDPAGTDPLTQHLRYERARALHQWDAANPEYAGVYADLAHHAVEPALRVMAAGKMIAHTIRVNRSTDEASEWVETGRRALGDLTTGPAWLIHLVTSRYHRAAALYFHKTKHREQTTAALASASEEDENLHRAAGENLLIAQLARENRRIILESTVKSRIGAAPDSIAQACAELDELDPAYPSSQFFLGELHYRAGAVEQAAGHFERGGRGGAVRGAMSAFRAYECRAELGDAAGARRCLDLLHDLDPAADVAGYLDELRTRHEPVESGAPR